eukprot:TRINITY_DN11430_c0_g2_i1.p1 TRINITY_DN11430_c0_g2~~TRINITY_DN11430_c0_g2_i1.p1  ORF type:complete len:668 (+),score=105.84 TRINITY_DN11430_c0_g2_i1:1012-3015(+)
MLLFWNGLALLVLHSLFGLPSVRAKRIVLSKDQFYQGQLDSNTSLLEFEYTSSNPGAPCSRLDCNSGDRWVRITANAQFNQLQLVSNLGAPLDVCSKPGSECQVVSGRSTVGVVHHYGEWTKLTGNVSGCYSQSSRWLPMRNNTVYFSLRQLNSTATDVFVSIHSATMAHPTPGGCATQGPIPNNPMLDVSFADDEIDAVTFQQADLGVPRASTQVEHACSCDAISYFATITGTVQYEVYRTFVSDCGSDFRRSFHVTPLARALQQMVTVEGVKKHGTKITPASILPPDVKQLSAAVKSGQGAVYNVLVTDVYQAAQNPSASIEEYQSVYSPTHTYTCTLDPSNTEQPYCHKLRDNVVMATTILAFLVGLPLAFCGLRWYPLSLVIMGTLTGSMLMFMVINNALVHVDMEYTARSSVSIAVGLLCGSVAYLWWRRAWSTSVTLVFLGASMGFIVACWIFATPLTENKVFTNGFNFGMTFACAVLLVPILLLLRPRLLAIVSTSVIGTYCIVNGVDYFVGADFGEVYTNVLARATDPTFARGYTGSYFSADFNGCSNVELNLIMLGAWLVLIIIATTVQLLYTGKPIKHIPTFASEHQRRRWERNGRDYEVFAPRADDPRRGEHQPLLEGNRHVQVCVVETKHHLLCLELIRSWLETLPPIGWASDNS